MRLRQDGCQTWPRDYSRGFNHLQFKNKFDSKALAGFVNRGDGQCNLILAVLPCLHSFFGHFCRKRSLFPSPLQSLQLLRLRDKLVAPRPYSEVFR